MVSVEERYDHLIKTIRGYNISADFPQIQAAYEYAREHHGTQLRRDGTPYITHPLQVAQIVAEMRLDSESIMAALLHDCIEDTDSTYDDVAKRFGVTVADIVDGVTKLTRVQYSTMEEEQMENLRKMLFAMSKDIRVILIKIADRLHNMRTMEYQTPAKQKKKAFETMEIYRLQAGGGERPARPVHERYPVPDHPAPDGDGHPQHHGLRPGEAPLQHLPQDVRPVQEHGRGL